MSVGKVHCFYKEKRFGFIRSKEGNFFFADYQHIYGDDVTLSAGDDVSFDILGGSRTALNIRKIGAPVN
jgi:cold shock CspA family protein